MKESLVDQAGFARELANWGDGLRQTIETRMLAKKEKTATADFFEAALIDTESSSIEAAALVRLYDAGKITRAQLVSAIKVNKGPCAKFLTAQQLDSITGPKIPGTRLTIGRIEGVELTLQLAVQNMAKELLKKGKTIA